MADNLPDPNLAACLAFVSSQEGGWADVRGDRGKQTMRGVTLARFREWRNDPSATPDQLRALSDEEWTAIMVVGYYHPCRCQELPPGVALQVMDHAVNAGPRASVHILQRTLGVPVDGLVGPVTIAAAQAAGRGLIEALNVAQAEYYRSLDDFPQFGKGWLARDARRAAAALAAFDAAPTLATVVATHEEAVAQALDAWRAHPMAGSRPDLTAAVGTPPETGTEGAEPRPRVVSVSSSHDPGVAAGERPGTPSSDRPVEVLAPPKVERPMVDFTSAASGAVKGAMAGAALGPFGMAGGAAVGLAIQLVPQLSRWISGDGGQTANKIVELVQQATGSANPAAQQAALADPQVSGDLAVQLAHIAAEREAAAEAAQVERLKASLGDVANARQAGVTLAGTGSWIAYAPPILSLVILISFGVMIYVVLTRSISNADSTLASILLGTLAAMASQVSSYWLGSSSGSQKKDGYLANSVPASWLSSQNGQALKQ